MAFPCPDTTCAIYVNARCTFYESVYLPYTGITTNDSLQTSLQKIELAIKNIIDGGGSSSAIWGNITGTIINQTDLINYLSSNYTPQSRTLTINGVVFDLSANRSWNVGTVTNVAALTLGTTGTDLSSSVATSTTTPVITLNVPTASAVNRGALSAADWSTFNNKQNTVTASNGLTKVLNDLRLGGNISSNTVVGDDGGGWNLEFGQNLTRLLNFRAYASGSVNLDGATSTNIQTGTQSLGLSTTASTLTGATLNLTSSTGNTNIAASGEINLDAVSDVDITSSGGSIDVISAGTFITTSTAETEIRGTSGVYLTSTSGPVAFNTNSTNRLIIDNDGSWTINGATGTSGQALISNGSTSTPTWQTLSATIGGTIASTQVGYGSGANTLTSEAAFTYDDTSNTLTVDNILSNSLTTLSFTGLVDVDIQAIGDVLLQPNNNIILNTGNDILLTDALVNNNALTSLMGRNSSTGAIEERTVASIAVSDGDKGDITVSGSGTVWTIDSAVLTSGTYTPTLTNVQDITSSTSAQCQYMRVGNVVTVAGRISVTPSTTPGICQLGVSLPIASNFATVEDCAGTMCTYSDGNQSGGLYADITNNRAQLQFSPIGTTSYAIVFTFTYLII